jgi:hypothetical protein
MPRPRGAKNKTTLERERRLASVLTDGDLLPLDGMLRKMREAYAAGDDEAFRFWSVACAPYCHAKLAAVEQKSEVTVQQAVINAKPMSVEEWDATYGALTSVKNDDATVN